MDAVSEDLIRAAERVAPRETPVVSRLADMAERVGLRTIAVWARLRGRRMGDCLQDHAADCRDDCREAQCAGGIQEAAAIRELRGPLALSSTGWFKRHHGALKSRYIEDSVPGIEVRYSMGLETELEEILARYTTTEEANALASLARGNGYPCTGALVLHTIETEMCVDELGRVTGSPRFGKAVELAMQCVQAADAKARKDHEARLKEVAATIARQAHCPEGSVEGLCMAEARCRLVCARA